MTPGPQHKQPYFPMQNTWGNNNKITYILLLHNLNLFGLILMQFNTLILDFLKQLTSTTAELKNGSNLHLLSALQNAQFPCHYLNLRCHPQPGHLKLSVIS